MKSTARCFILALVLFWPDLSTANNIAPDFGKRSVVLVQGSEYGTAFAILHRGSDSYFLTSAHLINNDLYNKNGQLPESAAKRTNSDWFTVYDPIDGLPHDAQIVGHPDFQLDVVLLKVTGMQHRLKPLCLANSVPPDPPYIIASFTLPILQNPPIGFPFADQRYVVRGSSTVAPLRNSSDFQYSTFQEQGFSGGPIIDADTGAVFGIVKSAPYVRDASTGQWVVSQNSRDGVTIDAIRIYLQSLAAIDPALDNLPVIVSNDRTNLVPNLNMGGKLRLVTFDEPNRAPNMMPAFAAYDASIRRLVSVRFRQPNASAVVDRPTAVFPVGRDLESIPHLCHLANGEDAPGVVALRRVLTSGPGIRTLEGRVALVACNGHIIDSTEVAPSQMNGSGPTAEQIRSYTANLGIALSRLGGNVDERLTNFAADGLPLGDGELRGFYLVVHRDGNTILAYAWGGAAGDDASRIYQETAVSSISGVSDGDLPTLTSASLDQVLDRQGGVAEARPSGSATPPPISLRARSGCFYLWRQKQDPNYDTIPAPFSRGNVL